MASDEPAEFETRPRGRRIRIVVLILFALLIASIVGSQLIQFGLNIIEFENLFIRPFYFELYGGLILATLALFRLDFKNRRSLLWWVIPFITRLFRERGFVESVPPEYLDFKSFKMPIGKFLAWQVTKVLIGAILFGNLLFGIAVFSMSQGWDPELGKIWGLFALPFATPPFDPAYAQTNVVPLMPALTLLVTPILGAIGTRLFLLVGLTQFVRMLTPSSTEVVGEPARLGWRIAVLEALLGLGLLWTMFNSFFPSDISYNTKIGILGLGVVGSSLLFFGFLDSRRWKQLRRPLRKQALIRILAVVIIALVTASAAGIQDSIADARKVEWRGPYVTQQVSVSRHLAELDDVREIPYEFSLVGVPVSQIDGYVSDNGKLLGQIRLWDSSAAFSKLTPEIGLRPFIDFQDSDIIRFNETMFWSASMSLKLPGNVLAEDIWYNEHLHYSHVPDGFLLLNAHGGNVTETSQFFSQRSIYYGEGGMLQQTWTAYPSQRTQSDELGAVFYEGEGGIDVAPPISWFFDSTFFFSYRDENIHVLRFRDVFDRMQLLFPYFEYEVDGEKLDMFPVTDGQRTMWLMPLIVSLDADNVPWSVGNPFRRLVGYALIDVFTGEIQLIILGDDYFSELFKKAYSNYVSTDVPPWLANQMRYPEELYEWRVSMYNFFHVTDPQTFIAGREFYEFPAELDSYYIFAKPPGFEQPEFVGLLSLEFAFAEAKNLAGYMVVRNDYPNLGEMIFYEVDIDSQTKLLGPSAVREALEKNSEFRQLRTLLQTPRIGDTILYRVGEHDVYFIPVYTAPGGGVVTEIGAVAAVGATFTGNYYIGLSLASSAEEAFRNYLAQIQGIAVVDGDFEAEKLTRDERIQKLVQIFEGKGLQVARPEGRPSPHISFLEGQIEYDIEGQFNATREIVDDLVRDFQVGTVIMWFEDERVNFGFLRDVNGVVELHYVTISLN